MQQQWRLQFFTEIPEIFLGHKKHGILCPYLIFVVADKIFGPYLIFVVEDKIFGSLTRRFIVLFESLAKTVALSPLLISSAAGL
jgi:hypothetical protein